MFSVCVALTIGLGLVVLGSESPFVISPLAGPWCAHSGAVIKPGDFDGDGYDDVLCYDTSGRHWARYAQVFKQDEEFTSMSGWCQHEGAKRYIGDFNSDNRDDLLCHDKAGTIWIALAGSTGLFTGTSWDKPVGWCLGDTEQLHVGDFNGDGRADVLCHDTSSGYKRVSISADGTFFEHGSSWKHDMNWCNHEGSELHIGDFDGDGRDDILCHDTHGQKWIATSEVADLSFTGFTQAYFNSMNWCSHAGAVLRIGYLNSDRRADLICHDGAGSTWTAINNDATMFDSPHPHSFNFCTGDVDRFLIGSFIDQTQEQFLCALEQEWKIISNFE